MLPSQIADTLNMETAANQENTMKTGTAVKTTRYPIRTGTVTANTSPGWVRVLWNKPLGRGPESHSRPCASCMLVEA